MDAIRSDAESELLEFVTMMARLQRDCQPELRQDWAYQGICDFLMNHGRFWTPTPLQADIRPMTPSLCFHNAYILAYSRRTQLRYVEGYALGIIPAHHGWCVDDEDRVVDPTWASTETMLGTAYFGTVIPLDIVRRVRRSDCASAFGCYQEGFRIFREPFKEDACAETVSRKSHRRVG